MTIRPPQTLRPAAVSSESTQADLSETPDVNLKIEGDTEAGRKSGFSILLRGDVVASSILSSTEPSHSVTELERNTKLLTGSLRGETAGFVLQGTILAAEFDDPVPTIKMDGGIVDPDQWSAVTEMVRYGAGSDVGADPFGGPGESEASAAESEASAAESKVSAAEPATSVVSIDATDAQAASAYVVDVRGTVVDSPDTATVADEGDRVFGYTSPGTLHEVAVDGSVTRVDVDDDVEFSLHTGE